MALMDITDEQPEEKMPEIFLRSQTCFKDSKEPDRAASIPNQEETEELEYIGPQLPILYMYQSGLRVCRLWSWKKHFQGCNEHHHYCCEIDVHGCMSIDYPLSSSFTIPPPQQLLLPGTTRFVLSNSSKFSIPLANHLHGWLHGPLFPARGEVSNIVKW